MCVCVCVQFFGVTRGSFVQNSSDIGTSISTSIGTSIGTCIGTHIHAQRGVELNLLSKDTSLGQSNEVNRTFKSYL